MSGHTPGPWAVHFETRWPWSINIGPNVLQMGRIAYSTRQTSLEDVRDAVGFDQDERANVVRAVAEQEANARLIAAAPDMLDALKAARIALFNRDRNDADEVAYEAVLIAIAKAEGR